MVCFLAYVFNKIVVWFHYHHTASGMPTAAEEPKNKHKISMTKRSSCFTQRDWYFEAQLDHRTIRKFRESGSKFSYGRYVTYWIKGRERGKVVDHPFPSVFYLSSMPCHLHYSEKSLPDRLVCWCHRCDSFTTKSTGFLEAMGDRAKSVSVILMYGFPFRTTIFGELLRKT